MTTTDFTYILKTKRSAEEVFRAVNNVRGWWSGYYAEEIMGETEKLNDEFSFRAGGGLHYSKHKLVEVIPNKKVVWLTTGSDFNFIAKKDEWTGTKIIFEISQEDGETQLIFTHEGLSPEAECYNDCAPAWSQYLQNKLLPLINGETAQ
jgi:activator of Hsp90 ATPase-like protein